MTQQIKPSVTNPTISNIYESIQSERLVLRPAFQRRFVWTHEHQEQFIDTILSGYPFPEIYVCEGKIDLENKRTTQHVIDGQQRLTTIKRYIDGHHDRPLQKIPLYENLSDERKKDFLSYQIVVRDIGNVSEDTIREVFRRINLTKFKLEDIEIHNAVYDGQFIQAAKDILENAELTKYGVFRESEFTRMADLHFILLVMATIENGGYFPQDREVEPKAANYNEAYGNRADVTRRILKTFEIINAMDLEPDSIWFRKFNFFTLVVEITNNLHRIPNDIKERLTKMEKNIIVNKNNSNSHYSEYYSYMYQATHGRKARVTRAKYLLRDIFNEEE